jgi:hypothetical protein
VRYPFNTPNGDEEDLNQQVTAQLHYSLQEGATLLNEALRDVPISFSDEATVVAHQSDPLPKNSDTETDREIDWVIRDEDKLVGFESKYGAPLKQKQLRDELKKLRVNAEDEDVHLVVITHHASKPRVIGEFEESPVYWTNWISLSKRLEQVDEKEIEPEQRVPLRMFKDLFEVEDMEPFRGFNHQDKEQYRYFIRDLMPDVNRLGLENRGKLHNWTLDKASPYGYGRIVPKYISIPFVHEDRPPHNNNGRTKSNRVSVFLAVVDTEEHRVYAGVVFGFQNVSGHREMLLEQGDRIAEECKSDGFEMWIGRNSINNRDVPPEKTEQLEEMKSWLSDSGEKMVLADPSEDDEYRSMWFLRECTTSDPENLFESVVDAIDNQRERFLERDEFVGLTSLVDPGTVD